MKYFLSRRLPHIKLLRMYRYLCYIVICPYKEMLTIAPTFALTAVKYSEGVRKSGRKRKGREEKGEWEVGR